MSRRCLKSDTGKASFMFWFTWFKFFICPQFRLRGSFRKLSDGVKRNGFLQIQTGCWQQLSRLWSNNVGLNSINPDVKVEPEAPNCSVLSWFVFQSVCVSLTYLGWIKKTAILCSRIAFRYPPFPSDHLCQNRSATRFSCYAEMWEARTRFGRDPGAAGERAHAECFPKLFAVGRSDIKSTDGIMYRLKFTHQSFFFSPPP